MEFRVLGPIELWSAGRRQDLGPGPGAIYSGHPPAESAGAGPGRDLNRPALGYAASGQGQGESFRLRRQAPGLAPAGGRRRPASGSGGPRATCSRSIPKRSTSTSSAGCGGRPTRWPPAATHDRPRRCCARRTGCGAARRWPGSAATGSPGCGKPGGRAPGRHAGPGRVRAGARPARRPGRRAAQLLAQYSADETLVGHQMTALCRSGRPGDALSLYRETRQPADRGAGHRAGAGAVRPAPARPEPGPRTGAARPPGPASGRRRAAGHPAARDGGVRGPRPGAGAAHRADRGHAGIAIIEGMPGRGQDDAGHPRGPLGRGPVPGRARSTSTCTPMTRAARRWTRPRRCTSCCGCCRSRPRRYRRPSASAPPCGGPSSPRRAAVVILDDAAGHDQLGPLLPVTSRCLILITTRRRLLDLGWAALADPGRAVRSARRSRCSGASAGPARLGTTARSRRPSSAAAGCRWPSSSRPASSGGTAGPPHPSCPTRARARGLGEAGAAAPEVIAAFDLSYRALEPDHQQLFRRLGCRPVRYFQPARRGRPGRLHARRGGEGARRPARPSPAGAGSRRIVPVPRPHPRLRGHAGRARRPGRPSGGRLSGRLLDYYLHAADQADRVLRPFRRRKPGPVPGFPRAGRSPVRRRTPPAGWSPSGATSCRRRATPTGTSGKPRAPTSSTCWLTSWRTARTGRRRRPAHALALQASREIDDPARIARAARALSAVWQQTGQREASIPLAEEAATLCRSLADRSGEAGPSTSSARPTCTWPARASRWPISGSADALRRGRGSGGVADTLGRSGIVCWHLGRRREAWSPGCGGAHALPHDRGPARARRRRQTNLGRVHFFSGYHRDALDAYEQSPAEHPRRSAGRSTKRSFTRTSAASTGTRAATTRAWRPTARRWPCTARSATWPNEAEALNDIGAIYQSAACHDEALVHHERARAIAEEVGNLSQQLIALRLIADIHRGSAGTARPWTLPGRAANGARRRRALRGGQDP